MVGAPNWLVILKGKRRNPNKLGKSVFVLKWEEKKRSEGGSGKGRAPKTAGGFHSPKTGKSKCNGQGNNF